MLLGAMDDALQAGDLDAAREYQSQLAKAMPQSPLARMTAARLGLFNANPADAIAELQRLLQDMSNDAGLRAVLASGQLLAGSFEQALAEANALAAGGSAEMKQVQDLVRAASSAPAGSVERATTVAAALIALQQPAMARVALDRAAGDHAADPAFQKARVQTELRNGRAEEAVRLAREFASQQPDALDGQLLLAEAQAANRDHAGAAATYAQLWQKSPNAVLAMAYAQAMRRASMPDPEKPLREWLERQPRDHAVRITVASAMQRSGQLEAAGAELQRALAGLPQNHPLRAVALNNLANVYAQSNDPRALPTARQAHELGGSLPAIQDTYGWLLVLAGRAAEGLPLLQSAASASPREADIRYHYAAALAATGDRATAAAYLSDLLDNEGDFESRAEAERLRASL
jgi:predicted Zn-dependent protease